MALLNIPGISPWWEDPEDSRMVFSAGLPRSEWERIINALADAVSACKHHGFPGTAETHRQTSMRLVSALKRPDWNLEQRFPADDQP